MAAPTGAAAQAMKDTWAHIVDRVKRAATSPTFYRALERTVPIAVEDGFFVVGAEGMESQHSSAMNTGEHQMLIEKMLREVTNTPDVRFRFIEGNSYADWEYVKRRDAAGAARQAQTLQKKTVDSQTSSSWEEVYDQVSRLWANMENRSLATGKGRYLQAALAVLQEAFDRLYPASGPVDDATERAFARVIERVASLAGSDPAMVAYQLFTRQK